MTKPCLMCGQRHEPIRTDRFMDRHVGECPICGKRKLSVDEDLRGTALIACSVCGGGMPFLRQVAAALGTAVAPLLNAPEKFIQLQPLGSDGADGGSADLGPVPLPDSARVDGWCERLIGSPGAWGHVVERRVALEVIRDCRVGYGDWEGARGRGRMAFTFPCFADGVLVGLSMRYWPSPVRDNGLPFNARGHRASLFPRLPDGDGPLLICEGEWDVLAARTAGVEAVTSTAGQHWPEEWDSLVVGRRVVVAYDAGEKEWARSSRLAERLGGTALDLRHWGQRVDVGDLLTRWPAARFRRVIRRTAWAQLSGTSAQPTVRS